MRKLIYLLLLPLAVAVSACGGKKGSSDNTSTLAMIDSVDAHGLQRMQTSKSETDFKFKGKDYHSLVSRTPDENLPHVTNELGDTYVDNKIVLHLCFSFFSISACAIAAYNSIIIQIAFSLSIITERTNAQMPSSPKRLYI